MKKFLSLLTLGFALTLGSAYAADSSCDTKAADKKLAGAAKTSFLKKCNADAGAAPMAAAGPSACEKTAADKKLAGAAKGSFMKKCEADAKKK